MGKGTRSRQIHAEERVADPQKFAAAEKAEKRQKRKNSSGKLSAILLLLAVVLVAGVLVFNLLSGSGVFMHMTSAVVTPNYKANASVLSYFVHQAYSNYVSYIENYDSYYSSISSLYSQMGTTYDVYTYLGIDSTKSLKKQECGIEGYDTWYDYFAEQGIKNLTQVLIYCEAAEAEGMTLDEDEISTVESNLSLMKAYASYYGYTYTNYIANLYGVGVKEADVRKALELSSLASKYSEKLTDDFYDAATTETVTAFYEENVNDYLYADYLSYTLTATKGTAAEDATDEDKAALETAYSDDKLTIAAAAAGLLNAKTEEDFITAVQTYFKDGHRESYMSSKYSTYLATATGDTDEEKATAATESVEKDLQTDAETETKSLKTEDYAYDVSTDIGKYIFGADGTSAAAVNTTTQVIDSSSDSEGTYKITVYFVSKAASRTEDTTRNITYMVLSGSSFTADEASAAKEAFAALETKDADTFKTFADGDAYSKKTNFETVENLKEGAFGADEMDEWLFDDSRVAGDYELITTTSDSTTYYVLVLLDGIGAEEWYVDAEDDMVYAQIDEWYEEAEKTYPVTTNEKALNKVEL